MKVLSNITTLMFNIRYAKINRLHVIRRCRVYAITNKNIMIPPTIYDVESILSYNSECSILSCLKIITNRSYWLKICWITFVRMTNCMLPSRHEKNIQRYYGIYIHSSYRKSFFKSMCLQIIHHAKQIILLVCIAIIMAIKMM